MKILIGLTTGNEFLRTKFLKLRNSVSVPKAFHNEAVTVELGAPALERAGSLDQYFHQKAAAYDAMLVIADERCAQKLEFSNTALFIHWVAIPARVENPESFLLRQLTHVLNRFDSFSKEVCKGENHQVTLLPERNFKAQDWQELIETILRRVNTLTFLEETKALLGSLKKRRKPRRNTSDNVRYFIDDADQHFQYGKEHHSSPDTAPPHTLSCELNFRFRFGRRVEDTKRHFNVNRGPGKHPSIRGTFPNCHGEMKDVTKTSHLNMFMNDFF